MSEATKLLNDAFNARYLTPAQVAEDFIAPPGFLRLLGLDHCIMVGPRGSGKTTLLKMLQLEALQKWLPMHRENRQEYAGFIGIFVPADVRWSMQLDFHTRGIAAEAGRIALQTSAFCHAVCLALLETLENCITVARTGSDFQIYSAFAFDRKAESELVNLLAKLWRTRVEVPSLLGLRQALRLSQTELPILAARLVSGESLASVVAAQPFIGMAWLDALISALDTINEKIGCKTQRWALLLDELEIVPETLLRNILMPLRSSSPNLIFKLALSPSGAGAMVLSNVEQHGPTHGNDFKTITLGYAEKSQTRRFSAQLMASALMRKGIRASADDLVSVMGPSMFQPALEVGDEGIQSRAVLARQKVFQELALKDESFADALGKKDIDPANLSFKENDKRAWFVRKIYPLVVFRNHYRRNADDDGKVIARGAVGLQLYSGYPILLDLTEGNPRWVLNLADELAAEAEKREKDIKAAGVQSAAIETFYERFASLLRVYPIEQPLSRRPTTLFDFVERLGTYLSSKLLEDTFSADPSLSFTIDQAAYESHGRFIETCIQLGVFILMTAGATDDGPPDLGAGGLVGKRVRLCHRLAPKFRLPVHSTRPIAISSALSENVTTSRSAPRPPAKSVDVQRPSDDSQSSLF
ncbi:hypothetical protein SAMN02787142_3863 [Burkholderia sp. WP9]|uniref:ORC-CDC6 family AAA ATPase n=1 Tax=Burkholderia sp. WP9 TaxID=1500263 RepID=UPI00089C1D44|nr:hypothetical protein [Burkholderia sp. WP9]SED79934.1 hypothetical protein SAMN02787142_3863 [Burkholderia sp. WP9]